VPARSNDLGSNLFGQLIVEVDAEHMGAASSEPSRDTAPNALSGATYDSPSAGQPE
jgi:hypothetical protein